MNYNKIIEALSEEKQKKYHNAMNRIRDLYLKDMDVMRSQSKHNIRNIEKAHEECLSKARQAYESNPTAANEKKLAGTSKAETVKHAEEVLEQLRKVRAQYKIKINVTFNDEVVPLLVEAINLCLEQSRLTDATSASDWEFPLRASPLTLALDEQRVRAERSLLSPKQRFETFGPGGLCGYTLAKSYKP